MIGPFEYEHIGGLRRTDAVKVDLLIVVLAFELRRLIGLRVPAVEKSAAVVQPRCTRELAPADLVTEIGAHRYVADAPGEPVRSGRRRCVRHVAAVFTERHPGERDRAVARERVRID